MVRVFFVHFAVEVRDTQGRQRVASQCLIQMVGCRIFPGTLAAAITFVAFGVGFLVTPLLDLIDISSALIPSSMLNGGYVLPGAVVLAALVPCFCLAYVTRPVSERQRRYRLQKRKTTISDLQ